MPGTKKNKHFTWKKIILYSGGLLILLVAGALIYVNHFLNKSLPQVEGEIEMPVSEHVSVTTDDVGVPHIQAESLEDMYKVQGYVQAKSRMFQMEMSRRQASGTLSEVVGADTVSSDKYFRTLGLRRAAEASYDLYDDDAKDVLEWFSDGVNAYIDEASEAGTLPPEFVILGEEPADWTPIDSLTIGKYMAFDLGGHWERQAFNYYALDNFSEEKAAELMPSYPDHYKEVIEKGELDIAGSFEDAVIPEEFNGSNDWVVSGDKTASGEALLADDPHLGLATPSIWYQMHLEAEDVNVEGVIFAGVPGIILGHNEDIAWGVTNTGPDVQQLYMEERNDAAKDEFKFEDEWEEADHIEEPIEIKDEDTIDYEVLETRHGPIVSEFAEEAGEETALSLRWTALDPTTELQAILNINHATNWDEFEKGLEDFLAPAQNFVFADTDGNIAYKANGKIPIYEDGDDALLPLPGWEEKYEWDDFIPFDELPRVVNPDKGFIATANNKIEGDDYPYHISNVWAQPYRYERIYEVLDDKNELTAQDMKDLQMDATNLRAREFVPAFQEILDGADVGENEESALELLEDWGYEDDKDLPQPLIFETWMENISKMLYKDIPDDLDDLFEAEGQTTDELLRSGDDSKWVRDAGGMESLVQETLETTIEDLEKEYGEKVEDWKWGDYHQIQFKHPLSSASDILAKIVNKDDPLPVDGSAYTPMAARSAADGIVDHGASWRFVIDMEEPESGYHIVSPGQSGHLKSKWYNDQTEAWVTGDYHETNTQEFEGDVLDIIPED
ncbi:MAG TPA: penicillin acylase family protein [Pseudogracilibacillus sp.]|nr:penicillin acylase family protein [Pseudogracilibacillus sp.]